MTTTATMAIQIEVLTPKTCVRARSPNSGCSKRTTRLPCVTSVPRPLTTNDIASVAISALMRRRVTTRPLTSPTASPTQTPSAIATAGDVREAISAPVTPASA